MSEPNHSTLNLRAGSDGVAASIAQHIRDEAEAVSDTRGNDLLLQHVLALGTLAEHIATRKIFHPCIYTLWKIGGSLGDPNHYSPLEGGKQELLFQQLGSQRGIPAPPPDVSLIELVAAAVDDLLVQANRKDQALQNEVENALLLKQAAEAAQTGAEADAEELQPLRENLGEAEASLDAKDKRLNHLEGMLQVEAPGEAEAKSTKSKPRRIRVPDQDRIYCGNPTEDGEMPPEPDRIYEVGIWADGKQSWERLGNDLGEAIALRDATATREAVPA